MESLRILIADDHPVFRKGMRMLLESMPDMEVAAEATTGQEAVEKAAALKPDVVLMDLQMPDGSGLEAIRKITEKEPHIRILVVTLFEDEESVFTALRAGARGYFLKDADEDEIVRAIQAVAEGEAIFSPAIATRLTGFFASASANAPKDVFPELTDREREILALIAQGKTNATIAEQLTISLKTVRNHVSNIYSKLQVADRAQAAIRARDAGLS
ncbi:MAG: response regulator [Anaerolineales bacterium]